MNPDFLIQFIIDRVTPNLGILVTDSTTGVTNIVGNLKVTYPDGTKYQNVDFLNPDISALSGTVTIPSKISSSDGDVQRGTYIFEYTVQDQDTDDLQGAVKEFTFSFDEPEILISNTSDVAIPKVAFSVLTDFTQTDYVESIIQFRLTSVFPSTSEISGNQLQEDLVFPDLELDQVNLTNYYEGVYNPILDFSASYQSQTSSFLTVLYTEQKTQEFIINGIKSAIEVLDLIRDFRINGGLCSDDLYCKIVSLYSNIEFGSREANADPGNILLSQLYSLLNIADDETYQSNPITSDWATSVDSAANIIAGVGLTKTLNTIDVNVGTSNGDIPQLDGNGLINPSIITGPLGAIDGLDKVPVLDSSDSDALIHVTAQDIADLAPQTLSQGVVDNINVSDGSGGFLSTSAIIDGSELNGINYLVLGEVLITPITPTGSARIFTKADNKIHYTDGDGFDNVLATEDYVDTNAILNLEDGVDNSLNIGNTANSQTVNLDAQSNAINTAVHINAKGIGGVRFTSGGVTLLDLIQSSTATSYLSIFGNNGGGRHNINVVGPVTNIPLRFTPKGTGTVQTSSAHTSNISADDDVITKLYADTNYSGGGGSGAPRTIPAKWEKDMSQITYDFDGQDPFSLALKSESEVGTLEFKRRAKSGAWDDNTGAYYTLAQMITWGSGLLEDDEWEIGVRPASTPDFATNSLDSVGCLIEITAL